ncbi:S8 family peptidase [Jiangella mangrovi]|uniref:Subtilisin family serine protease n=1 Tax=Jiangella mangrovi TaxID=1524084 RepID=A0A7W9LJG8_9ACTN|nr:S8 family serine peptidase [Jiangella mangrovi]MBB5786086.1 subtilisin family serine protease [Jiangella mangrovi]
MTPHRPTRPPRPRRRAALAAVAVTGVVLATMAPRADDPAAAIPLTPAAAEPVTALPGDTVALTLVTGDRVHLRTQPGSTPEVARIEPAPRAGGAPVGFQTFRHDGDVHVVPSDASALLAADRLDPELFNVTLLAEHGLTGAGGLPLIVQYGGARQRRAATELPGATRGPELESIDASGVRVDPARAADFWAAVDGATGASAARLDRGLERIWLDRPVEAVLDESVAQVGAPEAWAAGFDGTGVTVAVLDTGIDPQHPDLANRIVGSRSFVPGEEVTDGHGHGTHVASTVAGSGAGSDGRYTGVAPGARLLVGKVLSDGGSGSSTGIIEGMEWAVEQGARVVSMSLGGDPTDGTDLMSAAVNRLSDESGALFVIAAGNAGPDGGTVGAPGAADAALTVAAVDKQDELASFSSRGPRVGDAATKPDIAAPGVAIAAARGAGTSLGQPVDELYTSANGTSMATPHVAGAAAILAQQHPDWTGADLKAALTSTATDVGGTAYETGAGRLDVDRATGQGVFSDGGVWFGHLPYPQTAPVTRTVTYTNTGADPVVLDLAASLSTAAGAPAPAGMIGVSPGTLTVPAGGTATATVAVDPTAGESVGLYQGRVTATGDGGAVRVTTVVGVFVEPETFELTVSAVAPEGSSDLDIESWLVIRNDGWIDFSANAVRLPGDPEATVTLPRGSYTVAAQLSWQDAAGETHVGLPLEPQARLDADTAVRFDLGQATRLGAATPSPTEAYDTRLAYLRGGPGDTWSLEATLTGDYGAENFWITPTAPVGTGTLELTSQLVLGPPPLTLQTMGARPLTLTPRYRSADATEPRLDRRRPLPVVDGGRGDDLSGVDAEGALVLMTPDDLCTPGCGPELAGRVAAAASAGAAGVLVAGTTARPSLGDAELALPVATLPPSEGAALEAELALRPVRVRVGGDPTVPSLRLLSYRESGAVPADLTYEVADDELTVVHHDLHAGAADAGEARRLVWTVDGGGLQLPYVTTPRRLTVLVGSADADALHAIDLQDDDDSDLGLFMESTRRVYGPPGPHVVAWNSGPQVPGASSGWSGLDDQAGPMRACSGCRMGDVFLPFMYLGTSRRHESGLLGLVEGGMLAPSSHICRPDDPEHPPSSPPRYRCEVHLYRADGTEIEPRLVSDAPMIPPLSAGATGTEEDR